MRYFISSLRKLARQEAGNVMMIVGVGMLALTAGTGTAVDVGRAQFVQSKLSQSLDSAGLAAGADASSRDITTEATKYFNANYPTGYMGATVHDFTVTPNEDNSIISLSAQADVPTTFMRMFGRNTITVSATAEVTRASRGMELVLVMDITGSMNSNGKLAAMKTAATTLIDSLYGSNSTVENLWVGLVPFSQAVNIGNSRTSWLNSSHYSGLNWGTTSWRGCVEARYSTGRDITDDPPSVETFRAYHWADHNSYNNWISSSWWGGTTYTINSSRGPNLYCPSSAVQTMTANKTTILNAISALTAEGATHINVGAVWGWRMLSPRWRGLWGGEMDTSSLPLDYNSPLMNKVMVILTDGDNTMYDNDDTAYGYLSQGYLGTTSSSGAETALNNKLSSVCTSMKNNGVIIYTVVFDNPSGSAVSLMQGCASRTEYFFNSPSNSSLQTAFQQIADSLSNLRLSQ